MVGATPAPGATRKKILLLVGIGAAVAAGVVAVIVAVIVLRGPGDEMRTPSAPPAAARGHGDVAAQKPAEPKPRADGPSAAAGSTGIPACDAYLKTFDAYLACDKVSQATKDASRQAVAAQKASWALLEDAPAEAKTAAADACKEAQAVVAESGRTLGCRR